MAFKTVVVRLHNIKNEHTGSDSGSALEIFGNIAVGKLHFDPDIGEVISTDVKVLFDKSSGDALEINQGTEFPFPPDTRQELTIQGGEFLQITARLGEQDDIGHDDFFPNVDIRKRVEDIRTEMMDIPLQEDDQRIVVHISTSVTAEG
jgi:hypothetical protein